ncbi:hypothetical protein IV203_021750 [Nitzschia inconspicua]|uniref:Uncharacterized protein n=1 Tax=Nitzschia inconspicua TaxID=303405 RepID=A0A9K3KHB4_9STRA|nr:hypothetical protein IV203_021750 [Nitzschia inconspicua]
MPKSSSSSSAATASTGSRHPSVGVNDTLKRYLASKLAKRDDKRRKLDQMTQQQALERFFEIKWSNPGGSSSAPRNHMLTIVRQPIKGRKNDSSVDGPIEETKDGNEDTITPTQTIIDSADEKPTTSQSSTNDDSNEKPTIEQADTATTTTTNTTASTTTTTIDLAQQEMGRCEQDEWNLQVATDRIQQAKERVQKDQVELWGVYRYGLQHVMGLNDLASAPDAILPGNFVASTVQKQTSRTENTKQ